MLHLNLASTQLSPSPILIASDPHDVALAKSFKQMNQDLEAFPLFKHALVQVVADVYNVISHLSKLFSLHPTTIELCDSIFRTYLVHWFQTTIKSMSGDHDLMELKLMKLTSLLKIDGLVSLRTSIKINECQDSINLDQIQGESGPCSVYQYLLNEIGNSVIELKELLFDFDLTSLLESDLDHYLSCLLQLRESQILISNQWRPKNCSGFATIKD